MPTFDEAVRAIAVEEMPEQEHHLIETFQESTYFWANKNLSLMRTWVIETDLMLGKSLNDTDVRHFYIKLHGIIDEMYSHFLRRINMLSGMFGVTEQEALVSEIKCLEGDPRMQNYLILSVKMFVELEKIRKEFSESDLKKIMFFRHRYCHPMLTKLSVKINKKKRFTGVEIDKLMQEISEADELDELEVYHAKLLAMRNVIKEMDSILRTMQFS